LKNSQHNSGLSLPSLANIILPFAHLFLRPTHSFSLLCFCKSKGYGKAPEGSESAARAKRATEWVKTQIKQLVGVIKEIGQVGGTGLHETNFKDLFIRYET